MRLFKNISLLFISIISIHFCCFDSFASVCLPDFQALHSDVRLVKNIFPESCESGFPQSIKLEVNKAGLIMGMVCEYKYHEADFTALKNQIQTIAGSVPRIERTNLIIWRLESKSMTLMIDHTEANDRVTLICRSLRKDNFSQTKQEKE